MTEELSKTGGPDGPIPISELLQTINSLLSTLTDIQENLMAGLQQVNTSIKELHGLKRLVEAGTSTTNTTKAPSNKLRESISKEDSSMSSSPHPLDISGAESRDLRGTMGYDSLGNPYWVYSADQQPNQVPTFVPPETYRRFLNDHPNFPKTT